MNDYNVFDDITIPAPRDFTREHYEREAAPAALATQVGGAHYKDCKIQPIEFIHANGLGFCEGNVVKYITRWRAKGGVADLKKARHYIDLLIELESKK